MKKFIAAGLIAGTAIVGVAACNTDPPADHKGGVSQGVGSKDATADVKLGELTAPYGTVEIPVTITNHTGKASDYNIEATVYDANGVQVDTATTFIQHVAPHGKAHDKLIGTNGAQADHAKLTKVERTESF